MCGDQLPNRRETPARQPMLELLWMLGGRGLTCWSFSGGGTDFMRAFASEVYGLPPYRVIGSVGAPEFRDGPDGPELVKSAAIQVINEGPQKPGSIHTHIGQRPILGGGNTDGDLAMLQWTAGSPHRTLPLVVQHTDATRVSLRPIPHPGQRHRPRHRHRTQVDRHRHGRRLAGGLSPGP